MWVIDEKGRVFQTEKEYLETDLGKVKLEGKAGDALKTHKGRKVFVINPEIPDMFKRMKRGPQTINPKDAGFIAVKTGLRPGYRVLDAGAGSGFLTCFMAKVVGENGKIYAYERDKRSLKVLKENVRNLGLENIEIVETDVYKKIREKDLDLITLDLPEPWKAMKHARKALKKAGFLAVYLPNITQVQQFLKKNKMFVDSISEIIMRNWEVDGKVCRPKHHMLGHTGFIIILRNL
jgi:tRNA (adenine57-N1/adenine58-N1)-methyltransferase